MDPTKNLQIQDVVLRRWQGGTDTEPWILVIPGGATELPNSYKLLKSHWGRIQPGQQEDEQPLGRQFQNVRGKVQSVECLHRNENGKLG